MTGWDTIVVELTDAELATILDALTVRLEAGAGLAVRVQVLNARRALTSQARP